MVMSRVALDFVGLQWCCRVAEEDGGALFERYGAAGFHASAAVCGGSSGGEYEVFENESGECRSEQGEKEDSICLI